MAESRRTSGPADESSPNASEFFDDADPRGEALASESLTEPEPYTVAADETEAEELLPGDDSDIDDLDQLEAAEQEAIGADSSRPVRRSASGITPLQKKGRPTAKRDTAKPVAKVKRTTPVQFVQEAVGELRKVVWPTGGQLRQYFTAVLVFVLFIIAFVSLLDLGFGWLLLKLLG